MKDGQELLAEYQVTGSEAAFREVVQRYVNLVYSVAFRLVGGDTLLAEDVTQTVFINLARKADGFSSAVSLGGWLHEHTFHLATKAVRSEKRRDAREREAAQMSMLQENSGAHMAQIGPTLHEAIRQLGAEDQAAILLRFFEQRDFRAVGQALGSSEDAARMRVNRALEKLHGLLSQRGVTLSMTALAAGLTTEAVIAAPTGLVSSIASTALLGTGSGGAALTSLKLMTISKIKLAIAGTLAAAALATPLVVQHRSVSQLSEENQSLRRQQSQLSQSIAQNQRLSNLVAQAGRTQSLPDPDVRELLKLRAEVGLLRQQSRELAQVKEENRQLRTQQAVALQQIPASSPGALAVEVSARNECINHLRQIDAAIQQYALENRLLDRDSVTAEQIAPYLKNSEAVFHCPSGGTYSVGIVTNAPVCSTPGHAIPTAQ